ncbi:MAG: protein kinase [Planctomycetes bacterium]|nr:protein kinase [Planctomycetota bacterium]
MAQLKTFLFTDICRSVDLKDEMVGRSVTERDMAFIETILTPHRQRIEARLEEYGGRVVSTAGDGHFLVFDSTIQAAQWAVDVQQSHHDDPIKTPGGAVEVRISVHVGVPQVDPADPDNFVGKSVDYTSRLNDFANGSQILVSRSVMAILEDIGLDGISFHLHGRRPLKGIGRVEVHELLYAGNSPCALRQQPSSHSGRQWTVVPTMGAGQPSPGDAETSLLATAPALKQIGNYQLEERLGSGGMGDVYKGRHSQFERVRAIKVIKPQYVASGNTEMIERFYQEIKAIGALEHNNIVVAIDSSTPSDHLHYLVMEYIDGVSLSELVEQHGPLSVPDACEIIRQAARGLQYIHRNGMVHRDVKPSNLMVTLADSDGLVTDTSSPHDVDGTYGVVKILDLGLALLVGDQHERLTRIENRAMGTGMYMSPEQWKTTSVDIRADIYSLGCTLYHLLSGNPPFADSDLRPEKAHEKSRVPPIRSGNIPRKLWDILCKMLAKSPNDRFATPAEVAAALLPFTESNDLITLVRGYTEADAEGTLQHHTCTDSEAKVDTWLSRASRIYPSRRWLLHTGLPLVIVAGFLGFFVWSTQHSRKLVVEDAMETARVQLTSDADKVATEYIGKEIDHRFRVLLDASKEDELLELLAGFDSSKPREELADHRLQQWIREHRFKCEDDGAKSNSWFINDPQGIQIARSPLRDHDTKEIVKSFLSRYAYRNYFHGLQKDLAKDKQDGIKPLGQPNLSAVYLSRNSHRLKVAFSVPIFSKPANGESPTILGVLSMSVDLGEFEVLDKYITSKTKKIVLIDLREDYLESNPDSDKKVVHRGLILQHPLENAWESEGFPRVAPEILQAMDRSERGFLPKFQDPLFGQNKTYWGAFAPVENTAKYSASSEKNKASAGWVVLVQSSAVE